MRLLRICCYQRATSSIIRRAISTGLNSTLYINNETHDAAQHTIIPNDEFTEEFLSNRIKITDFQKILLSAGSSIAALLDPYRHDMIACLGETTGEAALRKLLHQMKNDSEANQILIDKPRINTNTIDVEALGRLKEDTLGYYYYRFLKDNNVTPDSRMNVKFMDDPELAYVMTRYRETHDLIHTLLGMPTIMLGEVAVKWIEAINHGLPMCYGAAIFGAIRLKSKQRALYSEHYLPWALETGRTCKPLLNVYWEKRWEQNIDDIRKELNVTTLTLFSKK